MFQMVLWQTLIVAFFVLVVIGGLIGAIVPSFETTEQRRHRQVIEELQRLNENLEQRDRQSRDRPSE
jgi:uncharacterized membrane-anchored protein YhcB (DUF1043 family)